MQGVAQELLNIDLNGAVCDERNDEKNFAARFKKICRDI